MSARYGRPGDHLLDSVNANPDIAPTSAGQLAQEFAKQHDTSAAGQAHLNCVGSLIDDDRGDAGGIPLPAEIHRLHA